MTHRSYDSAAMRESDLHRNIFARSADLGAAFPGIVVGPGDDCAVVRTSGGEELLLKVDQVVEGRHFTFETPVDLIARKAIARAVSDIAAMGGTPRWGMAGGVLPPGYPHADELCARLAHWGRAFGAPLVGGDIAAGEAGSPLVLGISLVGVPHGTRGAVLRSGARVGDEVWVTGKIGGSLVSERHLTFQPRVREGTRLCDALGSDLHAMMDVSDGLGRDAGRMATASGVRIVIEGSRVPLHPEASDVIRAAGDGEDYELLFCVAAETNVDDTIATRIGRVASGSGCGLEMGDGRMMNATKMGWEH
jgi:thiamine-monophosphate kinase